MGRKLTTADVCEVTGYSRDELHAVLKCLWPYCDDKPSPRVARDFSAKDLLMLSVTAVLAHQFGLRRQAVGSLGRELQTALSGPKKANRAARLVVTVQPPEVLYVNQAATDRQGVVVALGPLFDKVDQYLTFDSHPGLQLGPGLVASSSKRRHA